MTTTFSYHQSNLPQFSRSKFPILPFTKECPSVLQKAEKSRQRHVTHCLFRSTEFAPHVHSPFAVRYRSHERLASELLQFVFVDILTHRNPYLILLVVQQITSKADCQHTLYDIRVGARRNEVLEDGLVACHCGCWRSALVNTRLLEDNYSQAILEIISCC
jgi:hypothetical protein